MFMELSYIEEIKRLDIESTGNLEFVNSPDPSLSIRNCSSLHCLNEGVTFIHKVR